MDEIVKSKANISWQRKNDNLVMKMSVGTWYPSELAFPPSQVEEMQRAIDIFLKGGDPSSSVSVRP